MDYQCIIVGGGIAGLQAAIQLGRYMHRVLVIDSADGRSTLCHSYHNILGYPNGVSGQHLREIGKSHAEELGIEFLQDKVVSTKELDEGFQIVTTTGSYFYDETNPSGNWSDGSNSTITRTISLLRN